jgi:RND family efflux transporter MFP subunit
MKQLNSKWQRLQRLAMAAAVAAPLVFAGCGGKSAAGGPPAQQAMPVQVLPVETRSIADTTEYLALLKSRHSANINPQVEGYITKILVKSGDRVKAGETLLQIDPLKQEATLSGQDAARAAQESNVNLARINLERATKLTEAGVMSKSDFDNAKSTYDTAVAQLRSLEQQVNQQKIELRYYGVSAPMDGIVGDIPVHVGDRVTVSTLLTTVDEPGALEAYLYIPSSRSAALKLGLPVKLLDVTGTPQAEAQITFVSPQVDPDTQTVLAKAIIANPKANLRIAQQVRAQVTWGTHDGPVVPVLSVTRINGQYFVFVAVNEGKGSVARQKTLQLGEIAGNDYAVLSGLKAGEHLIVSETQFLQDGVPVAEQMQKSGASGATGGDAAGKS